MKKEKHVLIIEDEKPLLNIINRKLKKSGYKTIPTSSANEGMKKFESKKIDAVWLDHYLPEKNGLEVVSFMKENDKYKTIPIFLVSNSASEDKIQEYLAKGVNKYFVKSETKIEKIVNNVDKFFTKK